MTEAEIETAAGILAEVHRSGRLIDALPVIPASVTEGHAIQDRVVVLLGETVGGFKASAPADKEPTRGLIYARRIRSSPAKMTPAEVPHLGVEGEIAFRFTCDLPVRDVPYTREEIAAAVAVLPAIEVVSGRFRDPRGRPNLEQLADCTINGGLVTGEGMPEWSHLDLARLRITMQVNGETVLDKQGGHPFGDPLGAAVALANMLPGGVKAGQVVTTGSWTGMDFLRPGDRCVVRFESLGEAEVVFEG